ncbi:MAG: pseudaminic acid synthase [Salibacteraceae bacterium]|jgi:pseudaminic acid synthase
MNFLEARKNKRVYIIAELSANHGNSLEVALRSVEAAKRTGADAIKLQTYTADSMTLKVDSPDFMANPNGPWAGRYLYELYEEAALPYEWHQPIFTHAKNLGLDCLSSPFDKNAVDFLETFDPPAYKIASFEITDIPLIQYVAEKGRPVIMSTGIASLDDIELAVKTCRDVGNNDITVLKCTSSYPTKPEDANLCMISDLREKFQVIPGLSDHTLGIVAPVLSVAQGAKVIEKHFILDKSIGGPDASFSLDEVEFTEMVTAVRKAEKMIGSVDYSMSPNKIESRGRARSLYLIKDVAAGETVTEKNTKTIRPNKGLAPKFWMEIKGMKFNNSYKLGHPVSFEMLDNKEL